MAPTPGYQVPVNPVLPEATPERLTAILRHARSLESGEVVHVAVETSRETLVSRIARLRLSYAGSADAAPSHVLIWWNNLEGIMLAAHDLDCLELLE